MPTADAEEKKLVLDESLLELVILSIVATIGLVFSETLGRALVVLFPLAVGVGFVVMLAYSVVVTVAAITAREQKFERRALGFVLGLVGTALFGWAVASMIFGENAVVDGLRGIGVWPNADGIGGSCQWLKF